VPVKAAAATNVPGQFHGREREPEHASGPALKDPVPAATQPAAQISPGAWQHAAPAAHGTGHPAEMRMTEQPPAPAGAPPPARAALHEPANAAALEHRATEPARDISLRLATPNQPPVEVRLMERSGELRVAVKSADAELSQTVRAGLSELVERLGERGFDAEVWRPAAGPQGAAGDAGANGNTRHPGTSDDRRSADQNGARDNRDSRHPEQQNQRGEQPKWVDEIETGFRSTGKLTGA
jgi:hypothetical protein